MEKIYSKKEPWLLLHIIHRLDDVKEGRADLIHPDQFLQLSALRHKAGKTFIPHRHILKEAPLFKVRAQESWIVIKGRVKCILYDIDDTIIAEPILEPGDCSITLMGGHNYEILEDNTIVYEAKTGPYEGQEKDKVFI